MKDVPFITIYSTLSEDFASFLTFAGKKLTITCTVSKVQHLSSCQREPFEKRCICSL